MYIMIYDLFLFHVMVTVKLLKINIFDANFSLFFHFYTKKRNTGKNAVYKNTASIAHSTLQKKMPVKVKIVSKDNKASSKFLKT